MREDYDGALNEATLADGWLAQLRRWLDDAHAAKVPEPNAMTLATAGADGRPSARTVLLKGLDERGLVFYSHRGSRKGRELAGNPFASVVMVWLPLHRQVVVCGGVSLVDDAESDAYFASRPRGAQLGAAASPQSSVVASRTELDERFEALSSEFPSDVSVPRPAGWGGFRLDPETVEFWQGRRDRLHDRLRLRREGKVWVLERLGP